MDYFIRIAYAAGAVLVVLAVLALAFGWPLAAVFVSMPAGCLFVGVGLGYSMHDEGRGYARPNRRIPRF